MTITTEITTITQETVTTTEGIMTSDIHNTGSHPVPLNTLVIHIWAHVMHVKTAKSVQKKHIVKVVPNASSCHVIRSRQKKRGTWILLIVWLRNLEGKLKVCDCYLLTGNSTCPVVPREFHTQILQAIGRFDTPSRNCNLPMIHRGPIHAEGDLTTRKRTETKCLRSVFSL